MRVAEDAHDKPLKGFHEGHESHNNTPRDHNRRNCVKGRSGITTSENGAQTPYRRPQKLEGNVTIHIIKSRSVLSTRVCSHDPSPWNLSRGVEEEEHGSGDIIVVPDKLEIRGHSCDFCIANVRTIPAGNQDERLGNRD